MGEMLKFKWFWAWDDEREEAWLTDMARQGWHLVRPGLFGFYTFEQGESRNVIYRLDYRTSDKDMADYLTLFADAGWEHLGTMGGWQYFRKEAREGETAEIYTDAASKIQKYRRVLLILVVLLPTFPAALSNRLYFGFTFAQIVNGVLFLFMVLYVYAIVRLLLRIRALKQQV